MLSSIVPNNLQWGAEGCGSVTGPQLVFSKPLLVKLLCVMSPACTPAYSPPACLPPACIPVSLGIVNLWPAYPWAGWPTAYLSWIPFNEPSVNQWRSHLDSPCHSPLPCWNPQKKAWSPWHQMPSTFFGLSPAQCHRPSAGQHHSLSCLVPHSLSCPLLWLTTSQVFGHKPEF